jgi:hypothetical protein
MPRRPKPPFRPLPCAKTGFAARKASTSPKISAWAKTCHDKKKESQVNACGSLFRLLL